MTRQKGGVAFSNHSDAQRIDKARKRDCAFFLNGCQEVGYGLGAPSFQFQESFLVLAEAENIAGLSDKAKLVKSPDAALSQPFNIESIAGDEMNQPLNSLRLASQATCAAAYASPCRRSA